MDKIAVAGGKAFGFKSNSFCALSKAISLSHVAKAGKGNESFKCPDTVMPLRVWYASPTMRRPLLSSKKRNAARRMPG